MGCPSSLLLYARNLNTECSGGESSPIWYLLRMTQHGFYTCFKPHTATRGILNAHLTTEDDFVGCHKICNSSSLSPTAQHGRSTRPGALLSSLVCSKILKWCSLLGRHRATYHTQVDGEWWFVQIHWIWFVLLYLRSCRLIKRRNSFEEVKAPSRTEQPP